MHSLQLFNATISKFSNEKKKEIKADSYRYTQFRAHRCMAMTMSQAFFVAFIANCTIPFIQLEVCAQKAGQLSVLRLLCNHHLFIHRMTINILQLKTIRWTVRKHNTIHYITYDENNFHRESIIGFHSYIFLSNCIDFSFNLKIFSFTLNNNNNNNK